MRGPLFLLAAVLLASTATGAKASTLTLATTNPITGTCDANCGSFTDLGAQGFGNAPRILTLQTNGFESGGVAPNGSGGVTLSGDAISGADKASAPTIGSLGWSSGSMVAVGFNSNQEGQTGITVQQVTLSLYNSAGALQGSFSLAPVPLQYTTGDLALQQGNGNAVFKYVLDTAGIAAWNLLDPPGGFDTIGLFASLGCQVAGSGCQNSNDGADSFVALSAAPSTVPLPGTAILFTSGLAGLVALMRRRRRSTGVPTGLAA